MKKVYSWIIILMLVVSVAITLSACTTENAVGAGITWFLWCAIAIGGLIGLFLFVVWIICIIDVAKREKDEFPDAGENTKTIWLVVLIVSWVLSLNGIAAIVYYFMVMKKMPRKK